MITSLRLRNFKNFADETLHLGPFTVIVGANASGKSNIRDALRFLHGVGRGYTLAEIVGGKYGADWKPLRGSAGQIARFRAPGSPSDPAPFALEVEMPLHLGSFPDDPASHARYCIETRPVSLGGGALSVVRERLFIDSQEVFSEGVFDDASALLSRDQPALSQLPRRASDQTSYAQLRAVADVLRDARFFDLAPERMRQPAASAQTLLGDGGEDLAAVLRNLCEDPARQSTLAEWVGALTPMDVEAFQFAEDPSGGVHLIIQERDGARVPASSASEGTLRFLAMLAALLEDETGHLLFFEELENGLHPSRLGLLVELIERQTAATGAQVIATTHSPDLLSMVSDDTFGHMSVICRLEDTEDAIIRRVADLPDAPKLRTSQGLGQLLAGGWMEDALAFTDGANPGGRG